MNDQIPVRHLDLGLDFLWHDLQLHLCVYERVGMHLQQCLKRIFVPPRIVGVFCVYTLGKMQMKMMYCRPTVGGLHTRNQPVAGSNL